MRTALAVWVVVGTCGPQTPAPEVPVQPEVPVLEDQGLVLSLTAGCVTLVPGRSCPVTVRLENTGSEPYPVHRGGFAVGLDVTVTVRGEEGPEIELGFPLGAGPTGQGGGVRPLSPGEDVETTAELAELLSGLEWARGEELGLRADYIAATIAVEGGEHAPEEAVAVSEWVTLPYDAPPP